MPTLSLYDIPQSSILEKLRQTPLHYTTHTCAKGSEVSTVLMQIFVVNFCVANIRVWRVRFLCMSQHNTHTTHTLGWVICVKSYIIKPNSGVANSTGQFAVMCRR